MIVRVCEAQVRPGQLLAFQSALEAEVCQYQARYPGFVGHEILVDEVATPPKLVYVSVWRDEAAVAGFAGQNWQTSPVVFDGEDQYLLHPLMITHYSPLGLSRQPRADTAEHGTPAVPSRS